MSHIYRCTTPEQSKRLLNLGLSPNTADCYFHLNSKPIFLPEMYTYEQWIKVQGDPPGNYTPAWSTGQLMSILPKNIKVGSNKLQLEFHDNLVIYQAKMPVYTMKFGDYGTTLIESIVRAIDVLSFEQLYNFSKFKSL